ncbi:fumarate hydratase C-terminal domain-containing protein [Methanobrevibacter sp. TMH8]|uniref:fumarate hydratase C-terminal domain-containing protein n=1 Tax=Methanobrevibacter sp. TMH8 TaxID=2848611 RepID=UPI001CCA1E26|nr:fumarate hydratase C-terminal domain-containing protein [Methanobrevibacter sp. TMH8]MBZ9571061.1 fumarate hydratase C-terminal domain-containing protein [Methanobrevibacter sp. TMH8]
MKKIETPISNETINDLKVGDKILISGIIFTGRDAVLPKLKEKIANDRLDEIPFDLKGSVIMHTAVSDAGIAPTTSNKEEIESSIPELAKAGVKIHIGKGSLSEETKLALNNENSIFVVTPPVAALITNSVKSKKVVAYEEEGIEAIFMLEVEDIPGIVAIAHGESIY